MVVGGRYRFTETVYGHLPPNVFVVDVYTACKNGCYFHQPHDDTAYFEPLGPPTNRKKWERIGAVDFDETTVTRIIRNARSSRSMVPPYLKTEVMEWLKRLQKLHAVQ